MKEAIVQIPAFSESPWKNRLAHIVSQEAPEGWMVRFEAWVTPNAPTKADCMTWQHAVEVLGPDGVYEAPAGKLNARNAAHQSAYDRGADVIATWDADAPPLRDDTLKQLLMPFSDERVVAVNGYPKAARTPLGIVTNAVTFTEDVLRPQMHGQLSAFTRDGWDAAGPFDTTVDQKFVDSIRQEEEFNFRKRLASQGRIHDTKHAAVYEDIRRLTCKLSGQAFHRQFGYRGPDDWCTERGQVTFQPRDK